MSSSSSSGASAAVAGSVKQPLNAKQALNLKKNVMAKKMNAETRLVNDAIDNDLNKESDSKILLYLYVLCCIFYACKKCFGYTHM